MRRYSELSFENPKDAPELLRIMEEQAVVLKQRQEQIEKTIAYVEMKKTFLKALQTGNTAQIDESMKNLMAMTKEITKKAENSDAVWAE